MIQWNVVTVVVSAGARAGVNITGGRLAFYYLSWLPVELGNMNLMRKLRKILNVRFSKLKSLLLLPFSGL